MPWTPNLVEDAQARTHCALEWDRCADTEARAAWAAKWGGRLRELLLSETEADAARRAEQAETEATAAEAETAKIKDKLDALRKLVSGFAETAAELVDSAETFTKAIEGAVESFTE